MLTRRVWGLVAHVVLAAPLLLTAATALGAEPPSIEKIRELGADADFEASARLARERLASGALDRGEAAQTYLELFIVETARGEKAAGATALERALKLDPSLTLPDTVGPHVRDVFAEAKKEVPLEPLAVSVKLTSPKQKELGVSARVSGDPRRIARRVIVEGQGARFAYELGAGELRKVERPELGKTPCVTFVASVEDEFGNRLWPAISTARVCATAVTEPTAASAAAGAAAKRPSDESVVTSGSGERPIPTSVWIAGSVTVGLIGATTVLGLTYLDRKRDYDDDRQTSEDQAALAQLRESADRMGDMATVAGLAAGAAAITTGVLYFTRPRRTGARTSRLRAGITPAGVLVSGDF